MTPPLLDVAHIRRQAQGGAYERGVAYFDAGAVRSVSWDPASSVIESVVDGSGRAPYRCSIRIDTARTDRPILSTSCTCPLEHDCKHSIATLLASNRLAAEVSAGTQPPASWRALLGPPPSHDPAASAPALALGIELRQRVRRSASRWTPVRIESATPRGLRVFGSDVLVGLRPLQRSGRSDSWIKGAVSWESLRRESAAYEPAQARWFIELFSIARDVRLFGSFADVSEWVTLDDIQSHLFWAHLHTAGEHGVAVVPVKKHTGVHIARDATAGVRAVRASEGIRLSARISMDGEAVDTAEVRPIGRIGIYRFAVRGDRIELTLAPLALAAPVRALVVAGTSITVPAEDTEEFLTQHVPRLLRHVAIDAPGIPLPARERPSLVVTARFLPAHKLDFALAWRYGDRDPLPYEAPLSEDRDADAEAIIQGQLRAVWDDAAITPLSGAGHLSGIDAAEFGARLLPALEAIAGVAVVVHGERPRYRELTGDPHVTVSTMESSDPDWFDLGLIVTIDGRTIPFGPLFTALSRGRHKLLLSDGRYFSLAHPSLQRLRDLIDEAGSLDEWETGPRISRYQTALWADFEDIADESEPAVSWQATVEALRDVDRIPSTPPPASLRAHLRPYQQSGFEWLAFLWQHRLGGILADDMGLGKTIQMLALIAHARERGETRPFLVVAPTSVLSTWRTEAERFTPDLTVAVVDATRAKRGIPVVDVAAGLRRPEAPDDAPAASGVGVGTADVVITSYAILRLDEAEFAAVDWAALVLDEAQFVKNSQTKAHRTARGMHADVTFAITGTPLENSLTELWALLSLAAPGLFPSARRFRDEYVGPIEQGKVPQNQEGGDHRAGRLARLRRRIRPLVLRRTKELVAADLPPKQEQEVRVELGPAHRGLYDTVLQRERQKVLGLLDDLDRNRFIVFRSLTLLRMLSLAPELIDPAHAHIAPSKLTALFEQLDEILAEGHRTLVFSQFTSFLALAAARLEERGIRYAYLDGSTRDRDAAIASFRDGEAPVFLISLKAGGFGLTLTEADYVFLLDPWWNPAAESQAIDRAHRIGQTRPVNVYRLIANGTIEEKVMALQQRKARLFSAVMDDDALFSQALTADDIRGLLDA